MKILIMLALIITVLAKTGMIETAQNEVNSNLESFKKDRFEFVMKRANG